MNEPPAFGFKELLVHIISDMARAVSERVGETSELRFTRTKAAARMIMSFMPRDVLEAMLGGHIVMFHEVMTASVQDTLRGETDSFRRTTRHNIVALHKCFGESLDRMERYQARPSQGRRDEPDALPADAAGEAEAREQAPNQAAGSAAGAAAAPAASSAAATAPRTAREPSGPARTPPKVTPARTQPEPPPAAAREPRMVLRASPESIAACQANPEAMAALEAGDAEAFARAMGLELPAEMYRGTPGSNPSVRLVPGIEPEATEPPARRSTETVLTDGPLAGPDHDGTGKVSAG